MAQRSLVVLSLPFQRLIRSHFTPWLIDALTKSADVVVVSPFANESSFVAAIANPRLSHLMSPPLPDQLPWFCRKLRTISEIMRMRGYWFRRRRQMRSYWANRHRTFGENGNDTFPPLHIQWCLDLISFFGAIRGASRLVDRLVGRRGYQLDALEALAKKYQNITLIQAANWGFQDQALAWMARTNRWRTILLPYTSDQLYCNGYLYCDYDAVCVQGPAEKRFAADLHSLEPRRIVEFGSLNFYSMRMVLNSSPEVNSIGSWRNRILVVGVSATYFPTDSEFLMLDEVLEAVDKGVLGDVSVTYRPIPQTSLINEAITKRYSGRSGRLTIEPAPSSMLGLATLTNPDAVCLAVSHVKALKGYAVAVMAGITSLALDLSALGTPSVAYLGDPTGTLGNRNTNMLVGPDGSLEGFECIPVVKDTPSLVAMLKRFLSNRAEGARVAMEIRNAWDYQLSDLGQRIKSLLV